MKELTQEELLAVSGGGLELYEVAFLVAGIALSGGNPGVIAATVGMFALTEYSDYKDGV